MEQGTWYKEQGIWQQATGNKQQVGKPRKGQQATGYKQQAGKPRAFLCTLYLVHLFTDKYKQ
jgi:hypothetical protein